MQTNKYDGILEAWKVDLINTRARRLGVRLCDMGEVEQLLVPVVAAFRFDIDKANGATERTAITRVIDNRIKNIRRRGRRYTHHVDQARLTRRESNEDTTERTVMALDVREAVAKLPDRERAVCEGVLAGQTLNQVAHDLGCAWSTVNRLRNAIRAHFKAIGLGGWLGTDHE